MIRYDAILFERTERNELGVTISKQVTLRISFRDPHFSSKATEDGLFLVNLEAEAEETCFKAGLICHDQEDDLYQISNTLKQGLLVTTEAPGNFLESENVTKLECTGLLGR